MPTVCDLTILRGTGVIDAGTTTALGLSSVLPLLTGRWRWHRGSGAGGSAQRGRHVVQAGARAARRARRTCGLNPLRAKSDFICRYKCTNNLPDVPQPKLLQYPFDPMRYIQRGPSTALEESYSQTAPILAEPDLGVPIDLIDPEPYTVTGQEPPLNELDQELIEGREAKNRQARRRPCRGSSRHATSTR